MTEDLFEDTKKAALRLTQIASVSPSSSERAAAEEVVLLLQEHQGVYDVVGLDDLAADPNGRANAYALLRGRTNRTIILLGHLDTVDAEDYGELASIAFDPYALAARVPVPTGWLPGRGLADMKAGVAATISVAGHLAALPLEERPLSVVLLATPDEENESAGVLAGVDLLARLREEYHLDYVGVINTDYTAARYPGDPHRYIYLGSVGKLLPSFFIVGRPSHAGSPFEGLDANLLAAELIRDLSLAPDLVDAVGGQVTPPPAVLHATDLKTRYNTQIPYEAYFYLNVLTFTSSPAQVMERIKGKAQTAIDRVLHRTANLEEQWSGRSVSTQVGRAMVYTELLSAATRQVGVDAVSAAMAQEWMSHEENLDKRERSMRMVRRLWSLSGIDGPAVVLYFSPPYYPHVPPSAGPLRQAVEGVAAAHPELNLQCDSYFPLLSDMSYLRFDPSIDLSELLANMPAWRDDPGGYGLPLDTIRSLDLPAVNIGPYGHGAHSPDERVLMSYSFGVVPRLILETIESLGGTSHSIV